MFKILVFCSLFLSYASGFIGKLHRTNEDAKEHPVDIEGYPYAVSVRFWTNHNCGGILISDRFALSAAACSHGLEDYIPLFVVNAGSSEAEEPGKQYVKLVKIHEHPLFQVHELNYNVAVLEFEHPITFGPGVQPAVLADEGEIAEEGSEAFGLGYGCKEHLSIVNLKVTNYEECKKIYEDTGVMIDESVFCGALAEEDVQFCGRDIGGPLVVDDKIVGVLGNNYRLNGKPLVFTTISSVRSFIKEVAGV